MPTDNAIYLAAKALMPTLRLVPTDPKLYTSFAVAGDDFGTYHLLSHYREFSLLYVRVTTADDHIVAEPHFMTTAEDLYFFGCTHMGELFMRPSQDDLDFAWYRNNLYQLFSLLARHPKNGKTQLPDAFRPVETGHNNGPVILRLTQSLRYSSAPTGLPLVPAVTRYAF